MSGIVFVLVLRHLAIGAMNMAFTLIAGYALVWLMQRLDLSGWMTFARTYALRRLVCFVALLKGALFTLSGLAMKSHHMASVSYGFQFPDPGDLLFWRGSPFSSILYPTIATAWIVPLLLTFAAVRLIIRLNGLRTTLAYAESLRLPLSNQQATELQRVVRDCADSLGKPKLRRVQVEVIYSPANLSLFGGLPLVVGVANPRIVIDECWLDLSRTHAEAFHAAIRHELMHIALGHHRLRWLLLWLRDIAALTGLGYQVFDEVLACDEIICDTRSTRSAPDAKAMSEAIWLAHQRLSEASASLPHGAMHRNVEVFAKLGGYHASSSKLDNLQTRRLRIIAERLSLDEPASSLSKPSRLATLLRKVVTPALLLPLGVFLTAILACRVYCFFM